MMGWHSKLQSYNLSKRFAHSKEKSKELSTTDKSITIDSNRSYNKNPNGVRETETSYILPSEINNGVPIPKKFFNEEGDLDLRRATGMEAVTYLRKIGIQLTIPMM